MIQRAIFLFLIGIFISCGSTSSPIGLYGECGKRYYACDQLLLKSDHTFEYFTFMDVSGQNIRKGNWKQTSKDSITLHTFEQPKIPKTIITGAINPNRNHAVKIKLTQHENTPLGAAFVIVNNEPNGKATNIDGIVEMNVTELKSITYYYLDSEETIEIFNPKFNEIEITVKDLDIAKHAKYFINQNFALKNKKFYLSKIFFLRKTKIKNRQW